MNKAQVEELLDLVKKTNDRLYEQREVLLANNDIDGARARLAEIRANAEELLNTLNLNNIKLTKDQLKVMEGIYGVEEKTKNLQEKSNRAYQTKLSIIQQINKQLSSGWKYLIESDKTIRQTILGLGMSGAKAAALRATFQESARDIAHMGGSLQDVQTIMMGYANETGRSRVLTAEMVKNVESIAKGTGISVEQATQLSARFEYMGVSAKRTTQYVQDIVDTTERMGINTQKVLKEVNDNFKKLSTFSFRNGTRAFKEMAISAENTRLSMQSALNIAESTRNLESAIELGAQLQVMGGEFAKMDPLSWMYMVRNEPEKINDQVAKMTAGLFTLRKNSEGLFEKFISPADRDRLASVAKSLGLSNEEMFEMAQRQTDMAMMSRQLAGTGLSEDMKTIIKGKALFDDTTGKFQVQIGRHMKDISTLTRDQAKAFSIEQSLLNDRAVAAQDFDTALKATIEEFKTVLLPMLKGVNSVFEYLRKATSSLSEVFGGGKDNKFLAGIGGLGVIMVLFNKTVGLLGRSIADFISSAIKPGGGGIATGIGKFGRGDVIGDLSGSAALGKGKGIMYAGKGAGMRSMGAGAGIGAAALGTGAGIGAAAYGISALADSMSKLDANQAETLKSIVNTISILTTIGGVTAAVIVGLGVAGKAAAGGLSKMVLPILGIGAGIGIATAGIGLMGIGLSRMMDSFKGSGDAILKMSAGVLMLGTSMTALAVGGGLGGMLIFAGLIKTISRNASAISTVGEAFKEINSVLTTSRENFKEVESAIKSISSIKTDTSGIAELLELLKTPLTVKFENNDMVIRNDVTLEIDKMKFTRHSIDVPVLVEMMDRVKTNKN